MKNTTQSDKTLTSVVLLSLSLAIASIWFFQTSKNGIYLLSFGVIVGLSYVYVFQKRSENKEFLFILLLLSTALASKIYWSYRYDQYSTIDFSTWVRISRFVAAYGETHPPTLRLTWQLMMPISFASYSITTGLDPLLVLQHINPLISSTFPIIFYALFRRITKKTRIARLASLLIATTDWYIFVNHKSGFLTQIFIPLIIFFIIKSADVESKFGKIKGWTLVSFFSLAQAFSHFHYYILLLIPAASSVLVFTFKYRKKLKMSIPFFLSITFIPLTSPYIFYDYWITVNFLQEGIKSAGFSLPTYLDVGQRWVSRVFIPPEYLLPSLLFFLMEATLFSYLALIINKTLNEKLGFEGRLLIISGFFAIALSIIGLNFNFIQTTFFYNFVIGVHGSFLNYALFNAVWLVIAILIILYLVKQPSNRFVNVWLIPQLLISTLIFILPMIGIEAKGMAFIILPSSYWIRLLNVMLPAFSLASAISLDRILDRRIIRIEKNRYASIPLKNITLIILLVSVAYVSLFKATVDPQFINNKIYVSKGEISGADWLLKNAPLPHEYKGTLWVGGSVFPNSWAQSLVKSRLNPDQLHIIPWGGPTTKDYYLMNGNYSKHNTIYHSGVMEIFSRKSRSPIPNDPPWQFGDDQKSVHTSLIYSTEKVKEDLISLRLGYYFSSSSNEASHYQHKYPHYLDWSDKKSLSFWLYGDNSGNKFKIEVRDKPGNTISWTFKLNWLGWKHLALPLSTEGNLDKSNISYYRFTVDDDPDYKGDAKWHYIFVSNIDFDVYYDSTITPSLISAPSSTLIPSPIPTPSPIHRVFYEDDFQGEYKIGTVLINSGDEAYLRDTVRGMTKTLLHLTPNINQTNNKYDVQFYLDNDLEEIEPTVVADDNQTEFWDIARVGSGILNWQMSDDSYIVKKGSNGFKVEVVSGNYSYIRMRHVYSPTVSWLIQKEPPIPREFFCFWMYGANTDVSFSWRIIDSAGNYYAFNITDDFVGWRRFIIPFNSMNKSGTPDLSDIKEIRNQFSGNIGNSWVWDRFVVDNGQWVKVEVYVPDELNGPYYATLSSWNGSTYLRFADWRDPKGWYSGLGLYFLDGTKGRDIETVDDGRIITIYDVGDRGQTKSPKKGFANDITYSSYYGCKKRLGFAIRIPPDEPQDSYTTGISEIRLKLEVYYADDGKTTYEFISSTRSGL